MPRPIAVKRVYEAPSAKDGMRVLVDRLWPRGLTKQEAAVDAWLRDLAPSNELRRWYHRQPEAWGMFQKRYLRELSQPEASAPLQELYKFAGGTRQLTLLFASKNESQNNAIVLRDLLEGMRKPPSGTGLGRAGTAGDRKVKSMPKR
jgi:uncharacterized protein YeaO (DUF488 family)